MTQMKGARKVELCRSHGNKKPRCALNGRTGRCGLCSRRHLFFKKKRNSSDAVVTKNLYPDDLTAACVKLCFSVNKMAF